MTELRRAEADRNIADDRLRLAMESGKSVGWEWDLKTNRDTWFGDLSTIFGIPSNIYVGHVEDFRQPLTLLGGVPRPVAERHSAMGSSQCKEMELKESQRLAGVGGWQWDPVTDTVVWSEELYRIAGRDPILTAVSYKEHSQLYTPESWDRLRAAVEAALHTGAPYELDLEMVCADGTHDASRHAVRPSVIPSARSCGYAVRSRTSRSASVPKKQCPA